MTVLAIINKWIAVILFILIAATLSIFLYDFYSIVTKSTKSGEELNLMQTTRTSSIMIQEKIQSDLNTIYALSSLLSSFETIDSKEARAFLREVGTEFPFTTVVVSDLEGNFYTNNNSMINLSEPEYLFGSTGGNKNISVIYKDALYGKDMIALESHIYHGDQITGKVSGLFYANYINNILDRTADGKGYQYQIVDRNGDFILSTGMSAFHEFDNIYSILDNVIIYKDNSAEDIINNISKRSPGVSAFTLNGKANYFCYVPIGINNWYLIAIAPDDGINLHYMSMSNPTVLLSIRIIALFIILILYIVWRQIRYRVIMEKNKIELEELNGRLLLKNETLKIKAENDLLTGLYNKMTSELMITDYLKNEGKGGRHALLIIDIDDFKGINDELGHLVGDKALTDIANGIDHCLRTTDIKGRIGGDEFIILLKNLTSDHDLEQKADEICKMFKDISLSEGSSWMVDGSIGISIYPDHSNEYTDLFLKADKAMYYAKEQGKGTYYIYSSDLEN